MCCSVLQCVAVYRSVSQCFAVCCSVLQYVAVCFSLEVCPTSRAACIFSGAMCSETCCSMLQRWSKVFQNVLQYAATYSCNPFHKFISPLVQMCGFHSRRLPLYILCVAVCCSVWQCFAVCCSVLDFTWNIDVRVPLSLAGPQSHSIHCVLQCVVVLCSMLQCVRLYLEYRHLGSTLAVCFSTEPVSSSGTSQSHTAT